VLVLRALQAVGGNRRPLATLSMISVQKNALWPWCRAALLSGAR
jgi:hypothetical protein